MRTRILGGVRFTHNGGVWTSEDGRFRIEIDTENTTYCDDQHPVRITPDIIASVRRNPNLWCTAAQHAVWGGQKGYLCPGGEEHAYTTWHVWDDKIGDFVGGTSGFSSFTAAAQHFVRWVMERNGFLNIETHNGSEQSS